MSSVASLPPARLGASRPSEYHAAARAVKDEPSGLESVDLAVLATFTADLVEPYLIVEGARRGFNIRPHFLPFNQIELQAMDGDSALYATKADVIAVAWRFEDLSQELAYRFARCDATAIEREVASVEARVHAVLAALRARSFATLLIFNLVPSRHSPLGLADAGVEHSQAGVVQRLNDRIAAACRAVADCHVVDYARAVLDHGLRRWTDLRLLFRGRIPFGAEAQLATGRLLARAIRAVRRPACKCLVVDLDNTLWGGVLGEDGVAGIRLGEDHPGNAFKDFHRALLSLRDRGILLAVASKNDEREALAFIDSHPDCLVRREHFSAFRINWVDKATNLQAIASELSIGLDALAFFDDSPVEREWVRSRLPQVHVIEVPESPIDYIDALFDSGAFDQLTVSREDAGRASMYADERARQATAALYVDRLSFLRDLNLHAAIGRVGPATLPRVAQLLAKTNQFNLTTQRHSATDIAQIADDGLAFWLRVSDRFGDAGLVGVALALPLDEGLWELDTFLLSCRVIGRNVETALLAALCDAIRERGGIRLRGRFVPTPRNAPAADFLQRHGFVPVDGDEAFLDLATRSVTCPDYITVEMVHDSDG